MTDHEQKKQWLEDYVRQRMTPLQFAEHTGRTRAAAYGILSGRAWKDVPRPEGFLYPWGDPVIDPEAEWKAECLRDYVRERMLPETFAAHVGCTVWHAYLILGGKAWPSITRPEGFTYPWPERTQLGCKGFQRREQDYRKAYAQMKQAPVTQKEWAADLNVSAYTVREFVRRFEAEEKP